MEKKYMKYGLSTLMLLSMSTFGMAQFYAGCDDSHRGGLFNTGYVKEWDAYNKIYVYHYDNCVDNGGNVANVRLIKWSCSNGVPVQTRVTCSNGCLDGACRPDDTRSGASSLITGAAVGYGFGYITGGGDPNGYNASAGNPYGYGTGVSAKVYNASGGYPYGYASGVGANVYNASAGYPYGYGTGVSAKVYNASGGYPYGYASGVGANVYNPSSGYPYGYGTGVGNANVYNRGVGNPYGYLTGNVVSYPFAGGYPMNPSNPNGYATGGYPTQVSGARQGCFDTNYGNYNQKGTTYWNSWTVDDTCDNEITLREWYCDGAVGRVLTYNCPNGCQNGACK